MSFCKKILVVSRQAPYGTGVAREALDAALAAAIYEQDLSLLFMDDGVFQLLKGQDSGDISQKRISANLQALPLYGVEKIFVHSESLEMRKITTDELVLDDLQLLSSSEIGQLMSEHDQILSF